MTEQLTINQFLIDYPCKKDSSRECRFIACCEASKCGCCSGCQHGDNCLSRCVNSYKFVSEYDEALIERHVKNLLPTLKHNCGTVLLYEYASGNKAYGFVKDKEER